MKFENSTQEVTLEDCMRVHEAIGLCFIVEDGKDLTFEIEVKKRTLCRGPKKNL